LAALDLESFENEVRFRRADGQYRWHLCRGVPLHDHEGRIIKWYGILFDIDELKKTESALQEREHELLGIIDTIPSQFLEGLGLDGAILQIDGVHEVLGQALEVFHFTQLASRFFRQLLHGRVVQLSLVAIALDHCQGGAIGAESGIYGLVLDLRLLNIVVSVLNIEIDVDRPFTEQVINVLQLCPNLAVRATSVGDNSRFGYFDLNYLKGDWKLPAGGRYTVQVRSTGYTGNYSFTATQVVPQHH
jgi:PAS fold